MVILDHYWKGMGNSTVGMVLSLHMANLGSFPGTSYGIQAQQG